MKNILISILLSILPSSVFAQEQVPSQIPIEFSFWQISFAILAPLTLILIGFLLIKKFKL